ncbi:MAG: hypothetical protein ABII80_02445 [bacterium]
MNNKKKGLIIGLGIFLVILLGVVVVYLVLKPTKETTPSPTPRAIVTPKPTQEVVTPEVFVVGDSANPDVCQIGFEVVAVGSPSPSPSPSGSPSPSPSPSTTPGAELSCVVKRIYEDDSRNVAGNYYLEKEIVDTATLTNGQTIVYNTQVANNGGVAVSDTTITDVLASNLVFKDADPDCSYASGTRTVTCALGALAADTKISRSIRVTVNVTGTQTVENEAEVTSTNGQSGSCKITVSADGEVLHSSTPSSAPKASVIAAASEAPTELPEAGVFSVTANTLGVGLLLLIAGALGLLLL